MNQQMLRSEDLQGRSKRWIANRLGQKVISFAGIGTLVIIKDGYWAVRVRLPCIHCDRTLVVYLRPGCAGPDHYVYNFKGEFIADLRNQVFNCGNHAR